MAYAWQKKQKASTRDCILQAAASLLVRKGMRETSIAGLMKEAGLTVGGFYAHFRDKDELILASFRKLLETSAARILSLPGDARQKRAAFYDFYLSAKHRDEPESGCPMLPLLFEASRKDEAFRRKFAAELERGLQERMRALEEDDENAMLARFASMIGAQILSRATKGSSLSDRVLKAAAGELAGK